MQQRLLDRGGDLDGGEVGGWIQVILAALVDDADVAGGRAAMSIVHLAPPPASTRARIVRRNTMRLLLCRSLRTIVAREVSGDCHAQANDDDLLEGEEVLAG